MSRSIMYLMPRKLGRKNLILKNNVKLTFSLTLGFFEKFPQIVGAT